MEDRNAQAYTEDRIKAPEAQPISGLSTTSQMAGVGPTISGFIQAVFPDAPETGCEKQPSSAPGDPEKGPEHTAASEQRAPELSTRELRPQTGTGKKQSSWAPQEEPGGLQAEQDQTNPESKLGLQPPRVPVASDGLQQPSSGKEPERQEGRQPNPGTEEGQPPESCQGPEVQPTPGHQAVDMTQTTEPCCTLDSCGQALGDNPPQEASTPDIKPQDTLPKPGLGGHGDSSQEAMPLMLTVTLEEKMDTPFQSSKPGPKIPEGGEEAVETQPAPEPVPPLVTRHIRPCRESPIALRSPPEPPSQWSGESQGCLCIDVCVFVYVLQFRKVGAPFWTAEYTTVIISDTAISTIPTALPPSSPNPNPSPASSPDFSSVGQHGVYKLPSIEPSWPSALVLEAISIQSTKVNSTVLESERPVGYVLDAKRRSLVSLAFLPHQLNPCPGPRVEQAEEAFRSYFEIFNGPGEVDAQSLKSTLLLVGISLTPAQVEDALMSADIDGDGHVDFKDFLAVMTDTKRFFCSVEQNVLTGITPPNPHTLLFEILSLMVEMLALPEAALEEITNYYQKKLKEATCRAGEVDSAIGRLRSRKKLPYNPQQVDNFEVPERRVLRILSRLKQQNYAANLQSPYAQVPCIPLCPRLDKKTVRRKQGSHYVLDQYTATNLGPDTRGLFCPSGPQGGREHSSDSQKWFSSVPARTH
uniref:EF-hand domain-containing protein n=1 Tax=Loxodonta africana TaxID=9785 RepID=G3U192_LOXAF